MTRQVPRSKIQPNIVANRSRSPAEHISKLTTPPTQNVKDIVDKSFDQLAIVTLRRDPLRFVGTKIAGYEFPGQGPFARATVLKNKGQGIDKRTRNANGLRCVATGKISKCKVFWNRFGEKHIARFPLYKSTYLEGIALLHYNNRDGVIHACVLKASVSSKQMY